MSLSDIEINRQRENLRRELEQKCRIACAERGEEFKTITAVIPFANDDVPRYLADLQRFEEASRKVTDIIVRSYSNGNTA